MRIARPVTRTETDAAGDQGAAPQNVEVDDATPPVATPLVDVLPFSATRRCYLGNLGQFGSYKKKSCPADSGKTRTGPLTGIPARNDEAVTKKIIATDKLLSALFFIFNLIMY